MWPHPSGVLRTVCPAGHPVSSAGRDCRSLHLLLSLSISPSVLGIMEVENVNLNLTACFGVLGWEEGRSHVHLPAFFPVGSLCLLEMGRGTGVWPSRLDLPMPMGRQDRLWSLCAYWVHRAGMSLRGVAGVKHPEHVGRQSWETMPSTLFVSSSDATRSMD